MNLNNFGDPLISTAPIWSTFAVWVKCFDGLHSCVFTGGIVRMLAWDLTQSITVHNYNHSEALALGVDSLSPSLLNISEQGWMALIALLKWISWDFSSEFIVSPLLCQRPFLTIQVENVFWQCILLFFTILAYKTCKHWHKISAISSFHFKNISFSFQMSASCRCDRERNWRHRWYPAIERRCVCAHSWKPQLLLAGCPLVPVSSPSSTCLCLGFLSFSLPLQIFSNATEECSNVVEVAELPYPMSRAVVFSFSWYFMKRLH